MRDLTELDALARRLPGSFHLVAALDGRLRVQGTGSGLRLVFHAAVDGVQVAATSADVLAAATGEEPDEERLAVRLLWPVPYPLFETSLWRGVTAVPHEEALIIAPDGRTTRRSRWWTPPEPTLSLAEGAPLAREALSQAVDARTDAGGVVSCDLSGGLDSTSVCFLAARSPAHVVAGTWPEPSSSAPPCSSWTSPSPRLPGTGGEPGPAHRGNERARGDAAALTPRRAPPPGRAPEVIHRPGPGVRRRVACRS
ncbi:hypothetical protein FHS39_004471 [Streptomyces olivoverticillatus]|uniref:Asparagine synthetase domain-containing protein n=1 Tax=Streptomyces olivoverticillatus TaxID=66427 RepID=A0A7W7LTA6_9ACTN|nr:asparagine synthase-related protein [Streptomyces olivoverticillatus]MBB4895393.1 hypothetical protein [Streptomyces olivoverticillatus]